MWYRNKGFDRAFAPFLFAIGLIQLIEYGVYTHLHPQVAGKLIYLTLWLQVLLLAMGVYGYLHKGVSFVWMIAALIVFAAAVYVVSKGTTFDASFDPNSKHIVWSQTAHDSRGGILGGYSWLYILGITIPFVMLLAYKNWSSIGIYLLLTYAIVSAILVYVLFPKISFPSMWCYTAVGFVFLAYLVDSFCKV